MSYRGQININGQVMSKGKETVWQFGEKKRRVPKKGGGDRLNGALENRGILKKERNERQKGRWG